MTVTATWTPSSGQTAATDPPPPSVWLYESAQAEWTAGMSGGSADDGLGEKTTGSTYGGGYASSGNAPPSTPPAHWKSYPVTNGVATLPTRTLRAEGDSVATAQMPNGDQCIAWIDSYTVNVHAQPYGWYDYGWDDPQGVHHNGPNITGGVMTFEWGWKSTSGSLANLQNISIYEFLDYSGNPGTLSADGKTFYPKSPPIQSGYNVPNGVAGTPFNGQTLYARDAHSLFPVSSAAAITFTVPQKYKFDDATTGEVGILLYDCGSIVEGNFLTPSRWDTTELGYTAHTYYK